MTTYTVVNARGRTVLPASDAATAALYRRIFDDKHGQGSHRVVAAGPEIRTPALAPLPLAVLLALPLVAAAVAGPAWAGTTELVSVHEALSAPTMPAVRLSRLMVVSWPTKACLQTTPVVTKSFSVIARWEVPSWSASCRAALRAMTTAVPDRSPPMAATWHLARPTNNVRDIYVRDRVAGRRMLVSISSHAVSLTRES